MDLPGRKLKSTPTLWLWKDCQSFELMKQELVTMLLQNLMRLVGHIQEAA